MSACTTRTSLGRGRKPKVAYATELEAAPMVAEMTRRYPGDVIRAYQCRDCGLWHVGRVGKKASYNVDVGRQPTPVTITTKES